VEADGRGKLIAACANDVWEGVNIVTNNLRLLDIRKTILELILANHPQDCLFCVRSKNCELQSLAAEFNIRVSPFERVENENSRPVNKEENLTLDMGKCVKCGRCVEVCQEVKKIGAINTAYRSKRFEITTPYKQTLKDSQCDFCGKCADVCPVGAIYKQDE
jgi:NADH dehydrogenase/NADH:ubiquinone oxidoreductase subunit G